MQRSRRGAPPLLPPFSPAARRPPQLTWAPSFSPLCLQYPPTPAEGLSPSMQELVPVQLALGSGNGQADWVLWPVASADEDLHE